MKNLACLFLLISLSAPALSYSDCGSVTIVEVLGGPRHGSLFRIGSSPCASNGMWICLDPDAQHMTRVESDRAFGMIMMAFSADKKVKVAVDRDKSSPACGGTFPVLNDIRIVR